jgi:hypothetical protein
MLRTTARASALALAVLPLCLPASVEATSIGPPALGSWEGRGPQGLALSFELRRVAGAIRAEALAVSVPIGCPARARNTIAVAGTNAVYAGKAGTIRVTLDAPQYPVDLQGPLLSPRRTVLTMAAPSGRARACWPRALRFDVAPARRVPVADGEWTGTVKGAHGMSGTIQLRVAGRGRAITSFSFAVNCPGVPAASRPTYRFGPDVNGQFVAASGTFSGPAAALATPGLRLVWHGRFAPGRVSGTVSRFGDPCNLGVASASFVARPAA